MSLAADAQSAAAVQTRLKELYKAIKQIDEAKKMAEPTLNTISTTHRRLEAEEKLTGASRNRLIGLCEDAIADSEKEEECLRKALDKIYDIRRIRHEIR